MSHAHADAPLRSLGAWIITVSTSRSGADDRSGPVLRAALEAATHTVVGTSLVVDDPDAIGAALDAALEKAEVVILTGGTGISARDCTPGVVRERLDRELPGFGELFRMLSWQEVGSAAMLSTAVGGIARGRPVFALPGSPRACTLAMEKLILPELAHLVAELGKEAPLPPKVLPAPVRRTAEPAAERLPEAEPLAPPQEGIVVKQRTVDAPSTEGQKAAANTWLAALESLGGRIERGRSLELPEALERVAAVVDVLNSAGDRAIARFEGRDSYTAYGFPDLSRASSKVLLVREAAPYAEIVALHRWPRRVGMCAEGEGILPPADMAPGVVAEERTGHSGTLSGSLLAVEAEAVWVQEGRFVRRWDGRKLGEPVPLSSALGSLVLDWSQR